MSQFVRPAPWLRHLFTPSKTRAVNPSEISEDVSIVQPYDGSGWPLMPEGEWGKSFVTVAIAAADTELLATNNREIARILAVSVARNAGVNPVCYVSVEVGGTERIALTARFTPTDGIQTPFTLVSPIIGPNQVLIGHHLGGDAATVVAWRLYAVVVPIGTVFYV